MAAAGVPMVGYGLVGHRHSEKVLAALEEA